MQYFRPQKRIINVAHAKRRVLCRSGGYDIIMIYVCGAVFENVFGSRAEDGIFLCKAGDPVTRYDAVLFDVDGTLIHSSPGILATMEHTFRAMGIDPATVDLTRYLGPPLRRSFAEHVKSEAEIERMVGIYREEYHKTGRHNCKPFPGVREMLEQLRAAGVRLYTATSKPTAVVTPILQEQGLADYFAFIGGASEDKSVDTKTAVVRMVLARPELAGQRVLMVGDRSDDMVGAAECGIDAAAVLYGYGSRQELAPFRPVFQAGTCADLAAYIISRPTI